MSGVGVGGLSLVLRASEFAGPGRWRWLLSDEESGVQLADHEMSLDVSSEDFAAFTDLYRYARRHAVPDRRTASEAQIAARVGEWAGKAVLGERIGAAIVAAAPCTVRVELPAEAGFVLGWPLELAYADGRPLASRGDVMLAWDLAPATGGLVTTPAGQGTGSTSGSQGVIRVLAVFSLPAGGGVLALRRERFELARLVRRIGARQRRRVELAVVQYGATRERLAAVAGAGGGWDVLHLSGHGGQGEVLLEHPDGSPDAVTTTDLVALLSPLKRRVRVAVLSACESAAATTAETLRWMGLDEQAQPLEDQAAAEAAGAADAAGVARAVAAGLGCAVVAMRYPVTDDFAVALAAELYDRLLGTADPVPGGQALPLGAALARAVATAAGPEPTPARPALSLATPVLIGPPAASALVLRAPAGEPVLNPADARMAWFPSEPDRFVGRAAAMARASAALAPASGKAGVLLHGMAGSGKTTAALELAYRHQDSFTAAAFWQAPAQDDEFGAAMASFATALDIQLGPYGFAMADKITTLASLQAFAPRLRRLLEDNGVLLVLDNLETLLTPAGNWRDPRWEPLLHALTAHNGESRVILTSRTSPAQQMPSVRTLPIHALDLHESVALARELPGLRDLLHADTTPLRQATIQAEAEVEAAVEADRDLVRRVLRVVQGHPKLMELAAATAKDDPARLTAQVAAAEAAAAAGGQVLDAFFRSGTTTLADTQFLDALTSWTQTALETLSPAARLMAQYLAAIEEDDRLSFIVDANWGYLWRSLEQLGQPPDPQSLIEALSAAALIHAEPSTTTGANIVAYRMHPGIAQAIRATTSQDIQAAADRELATLWRQISYQARERERQGEGAGQIIVRAGLAAAPYLLRLQDWDPASVLLEQALLRDSSPGIIQAALPALRAIANATNAAKDQSILAGALETVDPAEAETLMRSALNQAIADQNFRLASAVSGDLVNVLIDTGRLREALDLADKKPEYTDKAGLGPWNQLADQGRRLQILSFMGEHQQVLDQIPVLRAQMDALPDARADIDSIRPWNVREATLDTGHTSALAVGDWQLALDINAAVLASKQARGAGTHEIARSRFNDHGPLIRLDRHDDADRVLTWCQQVFEDQSDLAALSKVFTARADLEDDRGNPAMAADFERTALRYGYIRPDPRAIAIGHHNLAGYIRRSASDPVAQRAHRLAAALLSHLTGTTHNLNVTLRALARELAASDADDSLPTTIDEVTAIVAQTEGVRLAELIAALQPDPKALAQALAQILDVAGNLDPNVDAVQDHLQRWDPVITLAVAAAQGDADAAATLTPVLDHFANSGDWAALADVLRAIAAGDATPALLDGLDAIDTAIATVAIERLNAAIQEG